MGASVGAVTGAIIAGNAPEERLSKLRTFWSRATQHTAPSPTAWLKPRQIYNSLHALLALTYGRPGLYRQRFPGLWSALPWVPNDVALLDHKPLLRTLEELVNFERLNQSETRLTVACADVETSEEVYFDSARQEIRPEANPNVRFCARLRSGRGSSDRKRNGCFGAGPPEKRTNSYRPISVVHRPSPASPKRTSAQARPPDGNSGSWARLAEAEAGDSEDAGDELPRPLPGPGRP